jgi:hypothetical protein
MATWDLLIRNEIAAIMISSALFLDRDGVINVDRGYIQRLNLPFRSAITLAEGAPQDLESAGVADGNAGIGSRLDEHQRGGRS